MTRARDAATNSHVTTFVHPTGAGNNHIPTGGATDQVLTYASAGTATWADAGGGGEQTFTATGAISAGNPVGFNANGTVSAMPKMAGDKLASKLLTIRQDIPIILNTGFSDKMTAEKAKMIGIKAMLIKPVVKSELAQTIRKVLES